MVAARSGSKHITTGALVAGGRLDQGKELATGRNIFHLAANTSQSIIGKLDMFCLPDS
jgi:hypothetical protein